MKAIRIFFGSISESFKGVFRNFSLSLASISCITITLILVGFSMILSFNVNNFTEEIEKDLNKKVDEYNKSPEGLELRYRNMYNLVKGMKQIDQYNKDKILMEKIICILDDLSKAGKEKAYTALNSMVNDKMLKEEPDEIPVDICEKGDEATVLSAG